MGSYRDLFPTNSEPVEWLAWFEQEPVQALLAALTGRHYFGGLNSVEPPILLLDWLGCQTDEFTFEKLDIALSKLIQQQDVEAPEMLPYGVHIDNRLWLHVTYLLLGARGNLVQSIRALAEKRETILTTRGSHPLFPIRFGRLFPSS